MAKWLRLTPKHDLQVHVAAGSPSGLARLLYKCVTLLKAVCDPSATERPLGTIRVKEGHFVPGSGFKYPSESRP